MEEFFNASVSSGSHVEWRWDWGEDSFMPTMSAIPQVRTLTRLLIQSNPPLV